MTDMYPFFWTTRERGVFMRYSHEYKLECIELFHQGRWPETPPGISEPNFRGTVRRWARVYETNGPDALKPKSSDKVWTAEEKMELVSRVLGGNSNLSVSLAAGIHPGMLYQWVRKYKLEGYNGLVKQKKGRPCKDSNMKKKANPRPLTESEREELIRLRAENEYIKAENEVIKKRIALRQEKWAAQLKAKKQQSSRNSTKKDTN